MDMLSAVEEESDIYEGFAPHVDPTDITVLTDTPTGKKIVFSLIVNILFCLNMEFLNNYLIFELLF